jgi:hypothetical protein
MDFAGLVRKYVAVADRVVKSLEPTVMVAHMTAADEYGKKTLGEPVGVRALVDWKQQQVRTSSGVLSVSRVMVTFLDVGGLLAATNNEGLDDSDRIMLPDGTTGPILDMGGFIDAGTGRPFATEVYLG